MTPTLFGRWQTRLVLLWTLGLIATVVYMWAFDMLQLGPASPRFWVLPILLGYAALLGLLCDVLYDYVTQFRWDRDWPLAFHFVAGIVEGALLFALFRLGLLPGAQHAAGDWWRFLLFYGTIWLLTFLWVAGPMRVVQPRWRFNGGEVFYRDV